MLRLLLLLVATFSLPWLAACGGGGGGGAPPQSEVLVDFGNLSTTGGAVLTFDAPSAAFASGVAFDGEWRANGAAVAPGRWASATTKQLVTVVPTTLPAGSYEVAITIGSARGRAVVQVADAPVVADPAATVQTFASEVVTWIATLRTESQSLRDPAQAASLAADLDRLELVRANFEAALATATPADLQLLATMLSATPAMAAGLAAERGASGIEANLTAVQGQIVTNTAAWVQGVALVSAGVVIGVEFGWTGGGAVVAAGLILAGGVQIVAGVGGVARATDLLMTAVENAVMQLSGGSGPVAGSEEVVIPSVLEGASAGQLTLTVGAPFPLRATASFASLSQADRTRQDGRIQAIFDTMDGAAAEQQGLAAAVLEVVQTPFPSVPAQPRIGTGTILGSALTIQSQSNPQVVLTLANGQLTATLQGAAAPVTTTATFRYDEGALGVLTQTVTVEVTDLLPNMVPIAAGTFQMGSGAYASTPGYEYTANELPVHGVTITQPFWMGKYEVTQSEYQAVMGSNPSYFQGATRPVETVTWFNAVAYCDALSVQEAAAGRLPSGYEYRLPTEAEWEYSCRAGTTTEWNVGSSLSCGQANFYNENTGSHCVPGQPLGGQTSAVGSYAANAWGLHDMHGNVWEWCLDSWDGNSNYPAGSVSDPYVTSGPYRVVRGGSWVSGSIVCRSAVRGGLDPEGATSSSGFGLSAPQFASEQSQPEPERSSACGVGPQARSGAGPEAPEPQAERSATEARAYGVRT
jgi:formylglycine-generating enzyme required for sulfatase activity